MSRIDPLTEKPISGNVVSQTMTQLRVSFEEKSDIDDLDTMSWRLDVGRSNIIFERMRTAISHFNHDPLAIEHSDTSHMYGRQLILQGTHLRDVLLRSFSPAVTSTHRPLQAADEVSYISHDTLEHPSRQSGNHDGAFKGDMRIQSWAKRYSEVNPVRVEGDPILSGLNATQTRAVAMMIGERISLVQGVWAKLTYFQMRKLIRLLLQPPGTGKTKTIIETVKLLKVTSQFFVDVLSDLIYSISGSLRSRSPHFSLHLHKRSGR